MHSGRGKRQAKSVRGAIFLVERLVFAVFAGFGLTSSVYWCIIAL